jgi:hypothetical protein
MRAPMMLIAALFALALSPVHAQTPPPIGSSSGTPRTRPIRASIRTSFPRVTNNFRKALIKHLEPAYPVVDTNGQDVLELRLAITNVVAEKKKRGLLGYTPVGFVIGA